MKYCFYGGFLSLLLCLCVWLFTCWPARFDVNGNNMQWALQWWLLVRYSKSYSLSFIDSLQFQLQNSSASLHHIVFVQQSAESICSNDVLCDLPTAHCFSCMSRCKCCSHIRKYLTMILCFPHKKAKWYGQTYVSLKTELEIFEFKLLNLIIILRPISSPAQNTRRYQS